MSDGSCAKARRHLDSSDSKDITLIITGGLRTPADFAKAMALGADGIAVSNAAIQAIGCLGMRACHTNNCPVGIATQKPHLRARLPVDQAAERLARFIAASIELMQVIARAAGHRHLGDLQIDDLTTFKRDMADLTGSRLWRRNGEAGLIMAIWTGSFPRNNCSPTHRAACLIMKRIMQESYQIMAM